MEDHEKKEKADAAKSNSELDHEALEKSKEVEKAAEEEKKDEEERQQVVKWAASDAAEKDDDTKAAGFAENEANEPPDLDSKIYDGLKKQGIFKNHDDAEAAAKKKKKGSTEALAQ